MNEAKKLEKNVEKPEVPKAIKKPEVQKTIETPVAPEINGPKMRKIVIETDGDRVMITANEAVGMLEFKAILTELLTRIR